MTPSKEILKHLSQDPIIEMLIKKCTLRDRSVQPSVYEALLRSISFQQLSGASATAIHNRFLDLFPNQYPEPSKLSTLPLETLREVGLSRQKAAYLQNTANFFLENGLLDTSWEGRSDESVIEQLTQIKGVGRWTVEMILMFTLQRPDVLPLDDLVVKASMIELYHLEDWKGKALRQKLLDVAEPWRPYRTTASLYMWQWKGTKI
ncbi:hypothetical protein K8352_04150 [Flavobacteriaceae bacterium F89]|uniref:DNA-3-methyladenine glycosylase II n=1 Tax=Cerina litoralis TaxID=2874477 RepID=A0AAE3EUB8_9FLAO|nr:hypothetical protein [Cerina litoralis]MCG2459926.1 hypothetical protein [Cerina litoralis]